MLKINRGWLVVAAVLAVGASSVARADDGGDNSMNPMYGDSYATLQGNGHNVGTQGIAPEGAYAAHQIDGQTTSLADQMHQTQAAIAERTHAAAERMRAALNPNSNAAASTTSSSTAVSATQSSGTTSSAADTSQLATDSGYRIAPVNPKGQAPTIVGPGG